MGQKVNPRIFRTGIIFTWDSKWFARGPKYAQNLRADLEIKKFLEKELRSAGVAKIEIERTMNVLTIIIHSAKPGVIIGRQGAGVEELKRKVKHKFFASQKISIHINIVEVDRPGLNALLIAQQVVEEIQKRMPYRRVLKQTVERVQKNNALGVRVRVSGRLNGAEIANQETLSWGKVPLHTLRANIDYARLTARTAAGSIGIKVWVYKGDEFEEKKK